MSEILFEHVDTEGHVNPATLTIEPGRDNSLLVTVDGCCGPHTVEIPADQRLAFRKAATHFALPVNPYQEVIDGGADPPPPTPLSTRRRARLAQLCQIPDCGCDGPAHP